MASAKLYAARMDQLAQTMMNFGRWFTHPKNRQKTPESCDFGVGNPHEMPLAGFVEALQKWSQPQSSDWYAYASGVEHATEIVATALRAQFERPYEANDIFMTNGATGALTVGLDALVEAGDEVIFNLPPWFFYEGMIVHAGGTPVRIFVTAENFDLDLAAIEAAITSQTRAIIVNSPHNPTGKIYPPETLRGLATILQAASERYGRPIYLISDEAYRRILFDQRVYPSPTSYYANSIMIYTYGKTLLTPGQRLGYLALSPEMPGRDALREALFTSQVFTGFAFPNSLLMHGLADLEQLSIDIPQLQRRRDRLIEALSGLGYKVHKPEGTFYLFVRSPWPDDWKFYELLADHDIFCLPGSVVETPGYFRLSLTASDEMIERSIPRFTAAMEKARTTA